MGIEIKITPAPRRKDNLDKTILSISGWRKIFSADGNPDSVSSEITPADIEMIAAASIIIGKFFQHYLPEQEIALALAGDSRPTSRPLCALIYRGLRSLKIKVKYIGVTAVPQLLSYTRNEPLTFGFIYVSASHNPQGNMG